MVSKTHSRLCRSFGALALATVFLALIASSAVQEAQKSPSSQVEVRVRVVDGEKFVDNLTLKDFELFENEAVQTIDSLYLVRGQAVDRKEETTPGQPDVTRSYYLLFQAVEWDTRLAEAVDYLFASVLRPGDAMTLVTPLKPYNLQKDALATKPKEKLSKSMQDLLRKDIQRGGGEYRDVLRTLQRISNGIDSTGGTRRRSVEEDLGTDTSTSDFGLEQQLDLYRNAVKRMESMRLVDENKLVAFAESIKSHPGQKTVFFFYEREFRPEISPMTVQVLLSQYQDNPTIQGNLMDLFQFYRRESTFNSERVQRAFSDAGIVFHFIFMDKKSQRVFGGTMREMSEDIFPGFKALALGTGGICEVSQNPCSSFQHAATVSDSYYLLRYTPATPAGDKAFRKIHVKVNAKDAAGKDFSLTARQGYFSK